MKQNSRASLDTQPSLSCPAAKEELKWLRPDSRLSLRVLARIGPNDHYRLIVSGSILVDERPPSVDMHRPQQSPRSQEAAFASEFRTGFRRQGLRTVAPRDHARAVGAERSLSERH